MINPIISCVRESLERSIPGSAHALACGRQRLAAANLPLSGGYVVSARAPKPARGARALPGTPRTVSQTLCEIERLITPLRHSPHSN